VSEALELKDLVAAFDRPREIVRPRILRLGVDYRF
jgi:hypothetical protein